MTTSLPPAYPPCLAATPLHLRLSIGSGPTRHPRKVHLSVSNSDLLSSVFSLATHSSPPTPSATPLPSATLNVSISSPSAGTCPSLADAWFARTASFSPSFAAPSAGVVVYFFYFSCILLFLVYFVAPCLPDCVWFILVEETVLYLPPCLLLAVLPSSQSTTDCRVCWPAMIFIHCRLFCLQNFVYPYRLFWQHQLL
jgi:hypothetical protein